jgi:hypothetical protein
MPTFAVDRELVPDGRRIGPEPGPFVADIGPNTGRLGPTVARRLQLDRGVVGEDRLAAEDVTGDGVGQGFEQCRRLADP